MPLVARIRDRALRDEYARRVAGWVGAADEMSVVLQLTEVWVSRRLVTLKARLQRTDPSAEAEVYNRLFGELMTLEAHRRDLRERQA